MADTETPIQSLLDEIRSPFQKITIDGNNGADVYGPAVPTEVDTVPVPASVTTTWGAFGVALGVSAPLNLRRARRAIRAMPGTGR